MWYIIGTYSGPSEGRILGVHRKNPGLFGSSQILGSWTLWGTRIHDAPPNVLLGGPGERHQTGAEPRLVCAPWPPHRPRDDFMLIPKMSGPFLVLIKTRAPLLGLLGLLIFGNFHFMLMKPLLRGAGDLREDISRGLNRF